MAELHTTRESWLSASLRHICVHVFGPAGYSLQPEQMKVSCSWPAGRAPEKAIGQCWPKKSSESGHSEMFISPIMADPVKVLEIVVHEMVHAEDDCESKHGAAFKKIAKAVGLEGPAKATNAGPALLETLRQIAADLGPYPHHAMTLTLREKKQKTYMLKCECAACNFVFRTTQQQIDAGPEEGLYCPGCGEQGTIQLP